MSEARVIHVSEAAKATETPIESREMVEWREQMRVPGGAANTPGAVARRRGSHDVGTVRIPLHSIKYPGLVALVDEQDADEVLPYRWTVLCQPPYRRFYAATNVQQGKSLLRMHRLILGIDDPRVEVDHIDGNGLNNVRSNLRIATRLQNARNLSRRSDNTSGFKGVSWRAKKGDWRAYIVCNGRQSHLGCFDNAEDAARAYDRAALERFGPFARLNFPAQPREREGS